MDGIPAVGRLLQLVRAKALGQEFVHTELVDNPRAIGQDKLEVWRELAHHLTADAARRSAVLGYNGNRDELAVAFRDRFGDRDTLRTDARRIRRVLDVAAG